MYPSVDGYTNTNTELKNWNIAPYDKSIGETTEPIISMSDYNQMDMKLVLHLNIQEEKYIMPLMT